MFFPFLYFLISLFLFSMDMKFYRIFRQFCLKKIHNFLISLFLFSMYMKIYRIFRQLCPKESMAM